MKLSDIGEFGFIERIRAKSRNRQGVLTGIGDDAAVADLTPGTVLLSTADLLAEGVHFDLSWTTPRTLGRKALAVNLSDIAAMGGIPRYALLSLAIPSGLSLEFMELFIDGLLEQASGHDVTLIGGDTSSSRSGLVIGITLLGEQYPDRIIRRSGAAAGDLVCMSGTAGDAALGLQQLQSGRHAGPAVMRHLDPVPRVGLGKILAERRIPSAMIDVSDGIAADLGHILALSTVGGRLSVDRIPRSDTFRDEVESASPDYYRLPLSGGEDYELLFTLPPSRLQDAQDAAAAAGTGIAVIGEILPGAGLALLREDGSAFTLALSGYDHFSP